MPRRQNHTTAPGATLVACALACSLGCPPSNALAQRVDASLSAGGGVATDTRGVRSGAASLTPTLAATLGPRLGVSLGGAATRFAPEGWALAGSGSATARAPLGRNAALTLTGAAATTATSFQARFLTMDATPAAELRAGPVTAYAGAHVTRGTVAVRETRATPGGLLAPSARRVDETRVIRRGEGLLFGGVAALGPQRPGRGATLAYREEHARVAEARVTDRTLAASVAAGRLYLSASGGARAARDESRRFGGVTATLGVGRATALQAAFGTYPSSRAVGTPGGRYANLGVVLVGSDLLRRRAAGGAHAEAAPAIAAPAAALPPGARRLALRAPGAGRVELAGDWTGWRAVPATRAPGGEWYVDVRLAPGEYRYAFRVDGARWEVPNDAEAVDDGFGGRSAVLTVR